MPVYKLIADCADEFYTKSPEAAQEEFDYYKELYDGVRLYVTTETEDVEAAKDIPLGDSWDLVDYYDIEDEAISEENNLE